MPEVARVLLHPADHPVIPPLVVEELLRRATGERALIPTYRGRGGHPVLIPSAIVESIISWEADPGTSGLRGYWESHPRQVQRVEFPDASELVMDLDSPEDYTAASE
jgi:CTP:molybdopterin cytidylyltransferase MocA